MRVRTLLFASSAVIATLAVALPGATAAPAAPAAQAAAPAFQLPFPCGQTWNGNSSNSSAHESFELDFNRGSSPTADRFDTVVAAADGTVRTSSHQGRTNGYGNLVKIEHADGYFTYYAHLSSRAVTVGQRVAKGQPIGSLGNTSKPGNNITPHLHFEVRKGPSYPANVRRAVFNGRTFNYPDANIKSNNCGTSYDPRALCGGGQARVIDSVKLGTKPEGTVNLTWNPSTKQNCVTTLKYTNKGKATATSAFLEPKGKPRKSNAGNFKFYAGPVKADSPSCVKWGGKTGGVSYTSPSEHC